MKDNISEMAEKMGADYFNRKLQDEVRLFSAHLANKKKDLKKSELVHLLNYIVKYPEVDKSALSVHLHGLADHASNAKDSFVALTVQFLIEEGKKQSEKNSQPVFKGE